MQVRRRLAIAGVLMGYLLTTPAQAGSVLYVDDDGLDGFDCTNAPYATIGSAIAAAKPGDEIRVCPGTYVEQVVVPFDMTIRGEAFGSRRAVIRPAAMSATLPTLDGGNPVAAAVLDDGHLLQFSDVDIDLAGNTVIACSPVLAGVYLRNASAFIERIEVYHAVVHGRPDCDSGVGVLVESGVEEIVLGQPVYGKARFIAKGVSVEDFQKAGIVVIGPQALVRLEGATVSRLPTVVGDAVPYGYEVAKGARGKIIDSSATFIAGSTAGKLAAGVLAHEAGKVTFRRNLVEDSQVGVLVVGDNARIKHGTFHRHSSDAIVLLGDSNLVTTADVDGAGVSGCFVTGDHNVVRGGFFTNAPIGLWFLYGLGNAFYGVTWGEIPLETRGLYGGLRDLTADSVVPFLTRCTGALSCDDGNACTTDLCDMATGTCSHGMTVCDDVNPCTTDTCSPGPGCRFTAVVDGTVCGAGTCTAGVCL